MTTKSYKTAAWQHFADYNPEKIEQFIADKFTLHPLVKKNLLKKNPRPKLYIFKDHLLMTMFVIDTDFELQEVNFLASKDRVVSFSRKSLPMFGDTHQTMKHDQESDSSTGHVLYHLADELVENHLFSIDSLADEIRKIQLQVFDNPFDNEVGHRIFAWRNKIHTLTNFVEEELEVIRQLARSDLSYIDKESGFYLQDLEEDFTRVLKRFSAFQEQMLGIIDLQTSLKSDHMNVIMKTLTLISAVFIPSTFIAAIYGTNFEYIPEFNWKYSYFVFWIVLVITIVLTILYFKKRRWW